MLAKKLVGPNGTVYRAAKRPHLKAFKRVKVCAPDAGKLAKQAAGAKAIQKGLGGCERHLGATFWADKPFSDTGGNRYDAQNDHGCSLKSGGVIDKLDFKRKRRGPGVTLVIVGPRIDGGLVSEPHVVAPKSFATSTYHSGRILKPLFPRMRAAILRMPDWEKWACMQYQSSEHIARGTMSFFKDRKIRGAQLFPGGADANPLEFFEWDSIENALSFLPKDQFDAVPKIEAPLLRIITELRRSPVWLASPG